MDGIMRHLNYCEFISFISGPKGIWHPEIIGNVVLLVLQKLSPLKTVTFRLDMMLRFLAHISQIEANWLSVVCSLVQDLPTDAYTITTIVIIMRALPSPNITMIKKLLSERYHLTRQRALAPNLNIRTETNICIVLNCLVEKLVGVQTTQIFTNNVCNYLCHIFMSKKSRDLELQLRALLTLEKFAVTKENKENIVKTLGLQNKKLLLLERLAEGSKAENSIRRQVRFCARWALDNIFPRPGRQLSYERIYPSGINGMLKNDSANIYLKFGPDLLEIRNDTMKSHTLHGTCEVNHGVWFYEVKVVTSGSLTIGWGLTGADKDKQVGNEEFSIGFEGNRRCIWYYQEAYVIEIIEPWRENDIIGCLLNIDKNTMTFYRNGKSAVIVCEDFFSFMGGSTKFFPAITISPFQHCIVNLGQAPFRTAPLDMAFSTLNTVGRLTPQQVKMYTMPRRLLQEEESAYNANEDACDICCDRTANVTFKPCGHRSLCNICAKKIHQCPLCRTVIVKRS